MPPNQTIQKLAFEGPLSVGYLVALGVLMAVALGFFSWRDSKASLPRNFAILVLLTRLAAVGIVLWMLAGPSTVTLERIFKPKSVVWLVDGSGSMGLIDAIDGSGTTVRWGIALGKLPGVAPIQILDSVIGSLQSARSGVMRLRQMGRDQGSAGASPHQDGQEVWQQVVASLASAVEELGRLSSSPPQADATWKADLARASSFLKDSLAAMRAQTAPLSNRRRQEDRLDETDAALESGLQRVERLSRKLAVQSEHTPTSREQTSLAAQSVLTRKEKVATWLEAAENSWLQELESKARVLRYVFASEILPVANHEWRQALANQTGPTAQTTDLGAALARAAEDSAKQSVDAVVLITDGGHNAGRDPREMAAALRGLPLHIVPIGTLEMPRDVILHHTDCPRAMFKNDTVSVDAMITAYSCQGENLQVQLLSDGASVETQRVAVASQVFDSRISFQWKGTTLGRHVLRVRVAPVPKEYSTENNEAQSEVEVMENTIRVLIADDRPRWEFRYLVNLFKRDPHIEFEQLLFEPNDAGTAPPALPRDLEGWRRYRIIILGDITSAHLLPTQQELLRKYVSEDGGNLVVIAGETAMPEAYADQPLGAMLPAITSGIPANPSQGFSLVVTAEGGASVATQVEDDPLASERIWREMSAKLPIYNLSGLSRAKPTSHVLIAATPANTGAATAGPAAFLSWQYVGLGRVVYLAAPVTYQLRYRNGDRYHHRFWGQLLRWAIAREMGSGSKTVHLATDKNRYEQGDQAQIVLRLSQLDGQPLAGAQCNVEANQAGHLLNLVELREEPGSPGSYRGIFDNLPPGLITLRAAGPAVRSLLSQEGHRDPVEQVLHVEPTGTAEMRNPFCNLPLLNQLADASGGAVIPPGAVEHALAHLDIAPEVQDTVLSREPLWNRWSFLVIILGCLTFEWLARKYWRLA